MNRPYGGLTPFDVKRQIDTAFRLAEQWGFRLEEYHGHAYGSDKILLLAAETNEVFSKNMVLNQFDTWNDVMIFFLGYEKADMAHGIGRAKK